MSLIREFHVQLSAAQYALFRDALRSAELVGDCRVILRFAKPRVEFTDYEGVQATSLKLAGAQSGHGPDWRSWRSVKRKIDKGVRENLRQK